jgi:hypothetical protein
MKCERCGAPMLEEQIAVSGDLGKLKFLSARHCTECERVEYGTMRSLGSAVNTSARLYISGLVQRQRSR